MMAWSAVYSGLGVLGEGDTPPVGEVDTSDDAVELAILCILA